MKAIPYSTRVSNPSVMTFLMEHVGDDSERFEEMMLNVMATQLHGHSALPLESRTMRPREVIVVPSDAEPVQAPVQALALAPRRKRKASDSRSRGFTEEMIPEFLESLVEMLQFSEDSEEDFVDMPALRGLFEKILMERYGITRGAKVILTKILKPTSVAAELVEILESRGAAFHRDLKIKPSPIAWAAMVPDGLALDDYLCPSGTVSLKNVFLGVRIRGSSSPLVTPVKPRKSGASVRKSPRQAPRSHGGPRELPSHRGPREGELDLGELLGL